MAELEAENRVLQARVEEQDLIVAAQAEQITWLLARPISNGRKRREGEPKRAQGK